MKLWRHERRLLDNPKAPGTNILTDHLTFEPRAVKSLVTWFVRKVFTHRHQVLRKRFGSLTN